MNDLARLTLVIPCLEEVDLLRRCLVSAAERLPGQRVVVVKMGGWRWDPAWAGSLEVRLLERERLPAAHARNEGARAATTSHLLFLDSDNWLLGDPGEWRARLGAALSCDPELAVLRRAEEGRRIAPVDRVTGWNFSRHVIEWNLVWRRSHFFELGGFDPGCGPGSPGMAQCGEAFDLCFRHFQRPGASAPYLHSLALGHPALETPGRPLARQLEYAYGSNLVAFRQLRRRPSRLALYWFLRACAGLVADLGRGRADVPGPLLARARLSALWDALQGGEPRPRRPT